MDKKYGIALRVLIYAACAVLTVGYMVVLCLAIQPDVPIEYEMYYITHELKSWPGYGKLSYTSGTTEYYSEKVSKIYASVVDDTSTDMSSMAEDSEAILVDSDIAHGTFSICRRFGDGWELDDFTDDGVHMTDDTALLYYISDGFDTTEAVVLDVRGYAGVGDVSVYINDTCVGSFDATGKYILDASEVSVGADDIFTVRFVKSKTSIDFGLWSIAVEGV